MLKVYALVAEYPAYLVDLFDSAHDEPLEVKLGGDAKVQVAVKGVVMSDERVRHSSGGDGNQNRRLNLDEAAPIHEAAYRAYDSRAQGCDAARVLVGDKVEVSLPVSYLDIDEAVPLLRQRTQRLA